MGAPFVGHRRIQGDAPSADFEGNEPPELIEILRLLAERLANAADGRECGVAG